MGRPRIGGQSFLLSHIQSFNDLIVCKIHLTKLAIIVKLLVAIMSICFLIKSAMLASSIQCSYFSF